jgi:hypothetical protein
LVGTDCFIYLLDTIIAWVGGIVKCNVKSIVKVLGVI